MLRVINVSRAQPAARNLSLITKRYQQSSASSGSTTTTATKSSPSSSTTQSSTKTPPSATKTQTTPPTSSSSSSSSSSYPSSNTGGSGGGTVKAIVYGVALGLGVTLLYAEYDNGSFRRKVESTLPLSSTILGGLDKIIDPVFGRHKKLTTIVSEKLPDVSAITDKLPDKEQVKKAGEQAKDLINDTYDKLPEYKKIEAAAKHAADQVKDAVKTVRGAVPDPETVKKNLKHAKEQVEGAAKSVRDTVKDALPATKGVSGEQSRKGSDPVFLEEPGEVTASPPIKGK